MENYKYRQILPGKFGNIFRKEKSAGHRLPITNTIEPEFSALSPQDRFQNAIGASFSAVLVKGSCKPYATFLVFISFYNELHIVAVSNGDRHFLPMATENRHRPESRRRRAGTSRPKASNPTGKLWPGRPTELA
jgi:hypothetical protein